ncbi:MAG: histidine kinase [Cyclobacteriaceae bacterium]|nr:histidine kinase [Cyclobacteriaceae bacterium]
MINIDRKTLLRELRDLLLLILFGLFIVIALGYTKSTKQFLVVGSFNALMWVFLWKGNALISHLISARVNWLKSPGKSLILLSAGSIAYTVGSVVLLMKLYGLFWDIDFGRSSVMIYGVIVVTIIISLFLHGRSFLQNWKQSVIDAEKLKRESVTARYESLKSQVNPHFLFNSLNALTNLVYEDQNLAAKFIKQLSEVYRYVLDTRNRELVGKEEELKFLESYIFLQKIRFGDNLNIDIQLNGVKTFFPPLVLQMLIENAIKHNVISTDMPLTIRIYAEKEYVIIENNLQKKKVLTEESVGIGLSNIKSRYEFLTGKETKVEEMDEVFRVKLPVIEHIDSL